MFINDQAKKSLFNDLSLWFLLLSNFVTIFFATKENWNLSTLIWIYWFQSITIGFFNFVRILQLKEFSTEGVEINNQPAQPTQGTKFFIAFFFLFHYGIFHTVYFKLLLNDTFVKINGDGANMIELKYIFLTAAFFFVNHFFSYIYNKPKDTKKQNIGSLMMYPYARIIPMHFIIGSSYFISGGILPFLILKTFADIIMHIVEHDVLRRGEDQRKT